MFSMLGVVSMLVHQKGFHLWDLVRISHECDVAFAIYEPSLVAHLWSSCLVVCGLVVGRTSVRCCSHITR